jgi:hypothetical protein
MPSVQKLLELERIVTVDSAGNAVPAGSKPGKAGLVAEFVQGPFLPTVVETPGDISTLYMNDPTKFTLISQGSFDPAVDDQNGSGVAFDGNGWAELKGKTFSGLCIRRVDTDMVLIDHVTKAFVSFSLTVNALDLNTGATATNKDIIIPAGTRFADQALSTATTIIATSQSVRIPAGTPCTGTLALGINFTQDPATGILTYVTTGATMGVTAFFVKVVKSVTITTIGAISAQSNLIDTLIDGVAVSNPLPGVNGGTVLSGTVSTINLSAAAADVYAASGGGATPSTLADCNASTYAAAIVSMQPGIDSTNDIVAIWSARNYKMSSVTPSHMRTSLWTNAKDSSAIGRGRVACVTGLAAKSATATEQIAEKAVYLGLMSSDSVVGADADRYWASGPYVQVFSTELNRDITISSCGTRAAMKVNLFNDGRSEFLTSVGTPYNSTIQNIDAQEPAFAATPLLEADYVTMKAARISWLVKDRAAGWWFYSGLTGADPTSIYANRIDDNRRSFADEVQDVIAGLAAAYSKLPGITERQDAFTGDMKAYCDQLVNPAPGIAARASDYQVLDGAAAGNTQKINAQGIFFFQLSIVMFGSMKAIVIKSAIGPNVVITQIA